MRPRQVTHLSTAWANFYIFIKARVFVLKGFSSEEVMSGGGGLSAGVCPNGALQEAPSMSVKRPWDWSVTASRRSWARTLFP